MDYQGNYFPEEQDENESKVYRTVKGIFKCTMYGISFLLYGIIIFLMFINRDRNILETNYMHNLDYVSEADIDEIEIYRINTKIFMNDDGSLQVHNIDYSDKYGVLEIGIKYNAKKLTEEKYFDALEFVLEDANGKKYTLVNSTAEKGGRYSFSRICFEDVHFSLDSNDLRFNNKLYGAAYPAVLVQNSEIVRDKNKFKLSVYRKSDNALIFEFDIYDNSTTFQKVDYNG